MGKKVQNQITKERREKAESVIALLRKQAPLTLKQEKFCNAACVERFLKAKGESVKKAARHLRACLSWRDSIGTENLMADEFSGELADGLAYVAGHDHDSRPVIILRIKQDYHKFHSHKMFTRLLTFTMEVAVQTMARNVEQFVLLFDSSDFRSAPALMNILLATLKIISEYYPSRLYKAFVIDPPSLFSYLWKGVGRFVELSSVTSVVSSMDYEDPLDLRDIPNPSINPSSTGKMIGPSASSRFAFTVSHNLDTLKPWYLSLTDNTATSKVGPARSYSFASPVHRTPRGTFTGTLARKSFIPSTPVPEKSYNADAADAKAPRTPKAAVSFFKSPVAFFRRGGGGDEASVAGSHVSSKSSSSLSSSFVAYVKLYRRPYDEAGYRSKMKPPLTGHLHHFRRTHVSVSQRF